MTHYYAPTERYLDRLRKDLDEKVSTYDRLLADSRTSAVRLMVADYLKTAALVKWFNFRTISLNNMAVPASQWTKDELSTKNLKQLRDIFSEQPFIGSELRDPQTFERLKVTKRESYICSVLALQEDYSDCPILAEVQ